MMACPYTGRTCLPSAVALLQPYVCCCCGEWLTYLFVQLRGKCPGNACVVGALW